MSPKSVFLTGATGYVGGDALFALTQAQPDWSYSVLVRDAKRGQAVRAAHPGVQLVIGSLDDYDTIVDAAAKADIVVHTADSSDHQGIARAIGDGLQSTHSSSDPGYWIHISGTGLLCWYDKDHERYGEPPLPEQCYDDLDGLDKITSVPDSAFHRDVDKIVLDYAARDPEAVKVAIVCPPTIYGPGRGSVNQISKQIPGLIATTLKEGFGPFIGTGQTEWDNVHVRDLSALIVLLAAQSTLPERNRAENEIWGPNGYHFAENGTYKWSAIAEVIAKEAYRQGLIQSSEAKELNIEVAKEKYSFQFLTWAFNSKGKGKRARKYLGWQPNHPSLEETIPEAVQSEALRQK